MSALSSVSSQDAPSAAWLADGEILLHIGVHKTGTSSIQAAMGTCRAQMLEQGVLYPERGDNHLAAAHAALHKRRGTAYIPASRWRALVRTAREFPGKVAISAELFCEATPDEIRRTVGALGPTTKVLITLRPLEEIIPSTWQQYVRSRGIRTPYRQWLNDVMRGEEHSTKTPTFWPRNDHGAVVERWANAVGPDRVAVLMVDVSQPRSIYDAFEDIIGLARDTLETPANRNRSMSAEEIELVRRLNKLVRRAGWYQIYSAVVRPSFRDMTDKRAPGSSEHRLGIPESVVIEARHHGQQAIERITAAGVTVFGELQALAPTTPIKSAGLVDRPHAVPIDAAAFVMAHVMRAATDWDAQHPPPVPAAPAPVKLPLVKPAPAAAAAPRDVPTPQPRTNGELAVSLLRDLKTPRKFTDRIANKARRERRKLARRVRARVSR